MPNGNSIDSGINMYYFAASDVSVAGVKYQQQGW